LHPSCRLSVMPSFLSRIRHRRSNVQPSTRSASPPPAPAPLNTTPNLGVPADVSPSPLVGLKIRHDLDSLLESYETEDRSPKRHAKDGPVATPSSSIQDGFSPLPPKPHVSRKIPAKSPKLTLPATPVSAGQPSFPAFAEASPLGGTFGRQESPLTSLGSAGSGSSHHRAPARSRSFGYAANEDRTLASAQWSGRNSAPTNQLPLSGTFERSSSVRSLPDKKRRIDRRRGTNKRSSNSLRTNRSSSLVRPRSHQSPTSVHQSGSESPRTFGYSTPPHSTRTFGYRGDAPPPLPPLDHPELSLDTRGSGSLTFGRSHKPSDSASSIPHVNAFFGVPQELTSGSSRKFVARKQSRTLSVDSRRSSRRSSAEWSSIQATEGVLTNSNNWQAQVSREILRLSLSEATASPATGDPGNHRDAPHVSATRLPAEAFVSPLLSPSPGSPLFLQGQPNLLCEVYALRLTAFLLFPDSNSRSSSEFRGGDRAAVTGDGHDEHKRMTEQGTPALQVTSGPSDTRTRQPLKSSLRASSTPRYSAISTVLATPTRSENLSSDSGVTKGKRKADEVDVTPPDQKSLHAKFAVPEDLPCELLFSFPQAVTLTLSVQRRNVGAQICMRLRLSVQNEPGFQLRPIHLVLPPHVLRRLSTPPILVHGPATRVRRYDPWRGNNP
jgi:hypothetical protein